jgi:putative ubiquitin-RnfH superfamily antitoxin RatB of RatAB toxin-antitoxin module
MAPEPGCIRIEVVLALPEEQFLLELEVPQGCTALEAFERSGLAGRHAGTDRAGSGVAPVLGVFGKVLENPAEHVLASGDRVEVYRPLAIEPRDARRRRAREAR